MKKTLLTYALFISVIGFLKAQSISYEAGLTTSNFRDYGGIVKKKTKKGNYHRFTTAVFNSSTSSDGNSNSGAGVRFALTYGLEKRKPINDKMFFFHGFQPIINATVVFRDNNNPSSNIGAGMGYILGLAYEVNKEFYVSIETVPSFNIFLNSPSGTGALRSYVNAQGSLTSFRISLIHPFEYTK